MEGVTRGGRIVGGRDGEAGRTGALVPAGERIEVAPRHGREGREEILHGGGAPVVVGEVAVHAGPEGLGTDQGPQHPDDLGALVVDGRRVEVVDLGIGPRPHRMPQRPGILGELTRPQRAHLGDAMHRPGAHVGGEFLVAEDRETSFRQSWNQSRQVTRLPDQLWKYSWAMIASMAA